MAAICSEDASWVREQDRLNGRAQGIAAIAGGNFHDLRLVMPRPLARRRTRLAVNGPSSPLRPQHRAWSVPVAVQALGVVRPTGL